MRFKVKNKVFLAPMEEVNDIAFRLLCKGQGAGLTYTQLTSPLSPKEVILDDKPVLQIFATSTRGIKEFIKKYDSKVFGWDFNLGCPAATARKHGYGAYLTDLGVIEKIVKEMRAFTKKPLSIKIRKSKIAYSLLKIAEKYCDLIIIHPRTWAQGYSGVADLDWAKEFKAKSKIPVVYSGNALGREEELLKIFDYVMLGRGAMGNPGVFGGGKRDFKKYLELALKYKLPFRQIKFQAMQFTKGERGSRQLRNKLVRTMTLEELQNLFFKK